MSDSDIERQNDVSTIDRGATASTGDARPMFLRGRTPLLVVVVLVVGGLALLTYFGYQLLCQQGGICLGGGPDVVETDDLTPTPFPEQPVNVGFGSDSVSVQVGASSPISLALDAPNFLEIGQRTFRVQSEVPSGAGWTPTFADESTAVWVDGTVINYVLMISDTENNRALIQGLAPGAPIALAIKDDAYLFELAERGEFAQNNTDVFRQTFPGITIILVNTQPGNRIVARGVLSAEQALEGAPPESSRQVGLGEPATLGVLQVTVAGSTQLFDRPEAPAGFDFFLVDFVVENLGSEPVDLGALRTSIEDNLGNRYAANQTASRLGNFPPLSGALEAGGVVQATVGFQIPAGLSSPQLLWSAQRGGSSEPVQVAIPFSGSVSNSVSPARVELFAAQVSPDGTSVVLSGQVSNDGQQALVIESEAVSLISGGTVHLILSTNPGFPWIVSPGQTVPFTVAFQRPLNSAEAVFSVANQSFQLSGLR